MAQDKDKKQKRPTAEKRVIQDKKKNLQRSAFKSQTKTAIRSFLQSLKLKEKESLVKEKLQAVYSMMDKGVKKRIFKKNKAARVKGKMSEKVIKK